MFSNSSGNMTLARQQAQANANYFQVPFVIFMDTSGNMHVERESQAPKHVAGGYEVVRPQAEKQENVDA